MSDLTVGVVKIGGSVLTGRRAYRRVAKHIANRLCARAGERLLVVVSAEQGATDGLLDEARDIVSEPNPALLDLLWSTGETRAAALLALHLQALGVRVTAANVHQTGLGGTPAAAPVSSPHARCGRRTRLSRTRGSGSAGFARSWRF
jgi:aspartokinase